MGNKIKSFIQSLKSKISSERGETTGDTFTLVISGMAAVVLMFGVPMLASASQVDKETSMALNKIVAEKTTKICNTGQIEPNDIYDIDRTANSLGIVGETEIVVQVLDENERKKTLQVERDKVGENKYYSIYNSQIMPTLDTGEPYKLTEGCNVTLRYRNTNPNWMETLTGFTNGGYSFLAEASGIVTSRGN